MSSTTASSVNILVVDDDSVELQALCQSLSEEGYVTICHDEPARALDVMGEQSFELLLTDLRMPEIDHIDMLRRARDIDPDITVIILTGYGTVPSAVEALRLGAIDYVQKAITNPTFPALASCGP